jgi:hypothetical protein
MIIKITREAIRNLEVNEIDLNMVYGRILCRNLIYLSDLTCWIKHCCCRLVFKTFDSQQE